MEYSSFPLPLFFVSPSCPHETGSMLPFIDIIIMLTHAMLITPRITIPKVRKSVYMMVHLCFGIITMYVATFLWRSQVAHGMFIVTLMVASAWNGAGFYFQLFSREYEQRMDEKVEQKVLQKEETKTDQNDQTDQGKKAAARGRSPARRTSSRSRSGSRTRTAKKAQ